MERPQPAPCREAIEAAKAAYAAARMIEIKSPDEREKETARERALVALDKLAELRAERHG